MLEKWYRILHHFWAAIFNNVEYLKTASLDFQKEVICIGLQILECHFFQNAKLPINK